MHYTPFWSWLPSRLHFNEVSLYMFINERQLFMVYSKGIELDTARAVVQTRHSTTNPFSPVSHGHDLDQYLFFV